MMIVGPITATASAPMNGAHAGGLHAVDELLHDGHVAATQLLRAFLLDEVVDLLTEGFLLRGEAKVHVWLPSVAVIGCQLSVYDFCAAQAHGCDQGDDR